jgi:hypothetical protein
MHILGPSCLNVDMFNWFVMKHNSHVYITLLRIMRAAFPSHVIFLDLIYLTKSAEA